MEESMDDDGSISGKITINHNKISKQTFGGADGDDFIKKGYVKADNLPSNLGASVIRLNDSTLELSLLNKAKNHVVDTNFILTFNDDAYANGGKADSTYYNSQKIDIEFIITIKVAKNGGDYDSIQNVINNADIYDIIDIAEGTYTEMVVVPEYLHYIRIKGAGPSKTIIQADTAPGIAKSRVFDFYGTGANSWYDDHYAYIEGVTIQNGYQQTMNSRGGGVWCKDLVLRNCRVVQNAIFTPDNTGGYGGGIMAVNLELYDCEVTDNWLDNGNQTGYFQGGGIFCASIYSENSTISGNFSRNWAGGITISGGGNFRSNLINTTITNNECSGFGGGIHNYDSVNYINSIIYGNTAGKGGSDIFQDNASTKPIKVWNSIIGKVSTGSITQPNIMGTPISSDPKLDTLAFNCSDKRTHALLSGSPAIDAGLDSTMVPEFDQRGFKTLKYKDIGSHEAVNEVFLAIAEDSICIGASQKIALYGSHKAGIYSGNGVSKDSFSAANIQKGGFVPLAFSVKYSGCSFEAVDSILVIEREQLTITKSKDSVCFGSNDIVKLKGSYINGTFTGEGVSNDTFTAVSIANDGYVPITFSSNGMGCTIDALDSILIKPVIQLSFDLGKDSICSGSNEIIKLTGSHTFGMFKGEGVSGDTFSAANIQNEGYVTITYSADPSDCAEEDVVDSIYVYKCVNGINQYQSLQLNVYPNPANDLLWIKAENNRNALIHITDMAGKTIIETTILDSQEGINIKNLPKGMYMVSTSIDGINHTQKFVKL